MINSQMGTALLFSGQGSQYVGMLKDITEKISEARILLQNADDILGFSLSNICFNGPLEKLKETRFTQPAIFLHSAALIELIGGKLTFDAVAGHSVGEYSALYSAGVLRFEDALKLVALRGKLMFEAGAIIPGTMFAIIGLDDDKVIEISNELNHDDNIVVAANFNSPGQVVVSGSAEYLRKNIGAFKNAGARMVQELVVSGAFHSQLMEPAREHLKAAINEIPFKDASVSVYSNVEAIPTRDASQLKNFLIMQLTSPVLWTQTLINMHNSGINEYIEIGPGKVLQGLVKRTLNKAIIKGYDTYDDIAGFISL